MAVPSDFANLQLWLKGDAGLFKDDAATIPATANADVIAVQQDQSGNGRHFTQTSNPDRPTLNVAALNGRNVIRYAGANSLFGSDSLTGFTEGEIWAVLRIDLDPPVTAGLTGIWAFGSNTQNDHYPWTDGVIYSAFGSTTRQTVGNPTPDLSSQYRIVRILSKAGSWEMWIDGVSQFSTGTNTVGWTTEPTIGRSVRGSAPNYHLVGDIAELFLYSSDRSADAAALTDYINKRFFQVGQDSDIWLYQD